MTITQDPWSNESTVHQTITCPVCSFNFNELGSTNCSICHQSLKRRTPKNKTTSGVFIKIPQKQIAATSRILSLPDSKRQTTKKQPLQKIRRRIIKTIESLPRGNYRHCLNRLINFKTKLITFWQQSKLSTQVKRFLARETSWGEKPLTTQRSTPRVKHSVKTEFSKSNEPTYLIPRGLFSYGGSFFGSPMVLGELNKAIESAYTDFKWRHTKAFDGNLNSSTGIKMLIEGNLTVAFSTRPLNDREIKRASMRGSTLKQTPIAIDGLVFFANNNLPVSPNLNLEQISKIYRGEINNWDQISSRAGNIPIVPIFLDSEDINVLGLKQPSAFARQVSNYNQLLSQVTSTPGAISFLSASLIQKQQPVKIFSLADGDRPSNYIPGLINGKPNLEAFQDGSYSLTRKLFVIYKQDLTFEQNAGETYVNFLNKKGQKTIEQAGFVPLRL
jgi:phosphate transport system substrate-binding protein